jgi:GAF domain-containing protein
VGPDPLFAAAKKAAQLTSIRSGFCVPVIDYKGECYGSLACHYDRPDAATNAEIQRTKIWATMIAHTISQYKGDGNE